MRNLMAAVLASLVFCNTAQASLLKSMNHMQKVMGMRVAKHEPALHWYKQVLHGYLHPPHKKSWLCIHGYEGSWRDPNSPYYGGLQMDLGFQRSYGRYLLSTKGTADHWSPTEQMWVAEVAFRSGRGFYPWPNTARYCGLI